MDELSVIYLLYADDQLVLAPSTCKLQVMVIKMSAPAKKRSMKVNISTAKVVAIVRVGSTTECDTYMEDETVKPVKELYIELAFRTRLRPRGRKMHSSSGFSTDSDFDLGLTLIIPVSLCSDPVSVSVPALDSALRSTFNSAITGHGSNLYMAEANASSKIKYRVYYLKILYVSINERNIKNGVEIRFISTKRDQRRG
ncbi:hypothetical protein EVAR_16529_1 [Eumeta japonica]|uniref:Reverse transcriptase domain-containing protein n=1 Tax=Eumeta variegata TaxID=151549 RepID=A0A4C1U4A4_EUMVA|nr:hypothetical protein EVAR_16529_1 [Eumeta japonica]